jgi:hypothetical protein
MKPRGALVTGPVVVAVLVIGYFGWPAAFAVAPIAKVQQEKANEAFDPVKYVADIQADYNIKNGKAQKPEKQSIDMILLTPDNYCQYKTFAPTASTEACPKPPSK